MRSREKHEIPILILNGLRKVILSATSHCKIGVKDNQTTLVVGLIVKTDISYTWSTDLSKCSTCVLYCGILLFLGQAGAVRLAISRALLNFEDSYLEPLQKGLREY